jgi:hypothetical protein
MTSVYKKYWGGGRFTGIARVSCQMISERVVKMSQRAMRTAGA